MYTITTEPARKLVRITINGLLTIDQVKRLYCDEHDAIRGMGCPLGQHFALVDLRACPLQFQEVVHAFKENITSPSRAKRLAMVSGNAASRLQARRILKRDEAAMFETVEEAEAWLSGGEQDRRAA